MSTKPPWTRRPDKIYRAIPLVVCGLSIPLRYRAIRVTRIAKLYGVHGRESLCSGIEKENVAFDVFYDLAFASKSELFQSIASVARYSPDTVRITLRPQLHRRVIVSEGL